MTGSRELTVLQAFKALGAADPDTRMAAALQSLAVSLAAIADLYELEVSCMVADEPDDDCDDADASEAHPS